MSRALADATRPQRIDKYRKTPAEERAASGVVSIAGPTANLGETMPRKPNEAKARATLAKFAGHSARIGVTGGAGRLAHHAAKVIKQTTGALGGSSARKGQGLLGAAHKVASAAESKIRGAHNKSVEHVFGRKSVVSKLMRMEGTGKKKTGGAGGGTRGKQHRRPDGKFG